MREEVLTPKQMGRCDALTIEAGTPGTSLMSKAGAALFEVAKTMASPGDKVMVVCGPGNNGGDGYVVVQFLAAAGYQTTVVALGDPAKLTGDAAWAHSAWGGLAISPSVLSPSAYSEQTLIIDALFGAGLSRPLEGEAAELIERMNAAGCNLLSVDLPSGVDGRTGCIQGAAIEATKTVTFHRLKPGHLLLPGRELCGQTVVADIGITDETTNQVGIAGRLTGPQLLAPLRSQALAVHKYSHGHAVVVGGTPEKAGAGFLAASAALRVGAGLVTLAAPLETHRGSLGLYPALMRYELRQGSAAPVDLMAALGDPRVNVCALGPGLSPDEATRQLVYAALGSDASLVLDAGALTAFSGMAEQLFELIQSRSAPVFMTPHEGEFARLFGRVDASASKIEMAIEAADRSGATVVLKGADTVVAGPGSNGSQTFINASAPPWLATAGSGDVLSGLMAGLTARLSRQSQNMAVPSADIAALAVWLHGQLALELGPGLVASDLEDALPSVLGDLSPTSFRPIQAG
ncbi:MAG: NAD(P)H-hydrate dehydratase [Pseudomonadota bacterium]